MDKKKAFKIAAVVHVVCIALMSVTLTPSNEKQEELVEEQIVKPSIKAASVSSAALDNTLDSFYKDREVAAQEERKAQEKLKDSKALYERQEREIREAREKLQKVNDEYEAAKKKAAELKKKPQPEPEKVKKVEKVVKKTDEKKTEQIAELKLKKQKEERLRKAKIENAKLLKKVQLENEKKAKEHLALVRGEYEKNIHDNLFSHWITPLHRQSVVCKVELMLNQIGIILGHRYVTPCPDSYKVSIEQAISSAGNMPQVPNEVFKSVEEVNFIDNGTNQSTVQR